MIGSATSRTSRPDSGPNPSRKIPPSSSGRDDGQAERLPELEVLGAAAGGDMDDPGPLLLPDLGPRHDPVLVRPVRGVDGAPREGVSDGGQVVERAGVAPADHLAAGDLLEHLERAGRAPS